MQKKYIYNEKSAFKVVQIKFLAMYITNQKLSLNIFTVCDLQNVCYVFGITEQK